MTDAEALGPRQTRRTGLSRPDANHAPPPRPTAHVHPEPADVPVTEARERAAGEDEEQNDAVVRLAGALRSAERAHRAYLAELRLADVEPAEDWSTWYAEYLRGLR